MRIRGILPFSLLVLSTCGHGNMQAVKTRPTPTPPSTIIALSPPKISPTHFKDIRSAVASILNDNVKVVAFGEIHKEEASNLPSTLHHFSKNIMPLLAENGITNIVLEHLPSGKKAHSEFKAFGKTHKLGPFLKDWFAYHADYCGVIVAFEQAHALGISLHGGNASGEKEYNANLTRRAQLINQRTLAVIYSLLKKKKRVAAYTGALHNNIKPKAGKEDQSFGHILRKELGKGYVEVDIYLPDLFPAVEDGYLGLWGMTPPVPDEGVNLINIKNGRYVLILPRFKNPIINHIPKAAPSCP